MAILKEALCESKLVVNMKSDSVWISNLLSAFALYEQMAMFKMAMKSNLKPILQRSFTMNPMTKLWQILDNSLFTHSSPKYLKLANMAMTIFLGLVKDERAFSTIGFVKGKLQNKLGNHLFCVYRCSYKNFILSRIFST